MDRLTEEGLKGWVAGFIDGEGTISIHKMIEAKAAIRGARHRALVEVTNTNLASLQKLVSLFGGSIWQKHRQDEHHLTCYRWRVEGQTARKVILFALPYFIVKKKQAEITLKFCKTLRVIGSNTRTPISTRIFALREKLYQEVQKINNIRPRGFVTQRG